MPEDILYSVNQVAILLKVHPLSVRRYIKEGKLKAVKIGGNVRVPDSSVNAFTQNIYPTSYSLKGKSSQTDQINKFTIDDPIFRLKGRGLSMRGLS